MQEALNYIERAVQGQYLELLPSRWAALLPRMAKRTQRLQRSTDITELSTLEKEVGEEFTLASQLLETEHELYREGISIFHDASGAEGDAVRRSWNLLAQDMLVELAAKEMMLAHWKDAVSTIPSDTLRVYSHALLVHARVSTARVQHLADLVATVV
ncbi:hypothetical protein ABL78_0575 [Leptomonas seymouri]|uniref:Uncharacterized protein n=1 Tax=Leptomonas seymouri TaxID=5684 RepID=A0A0N1PDH9_LEPSE|nr:hypothetical protein ABL78_0575 [Leptomonas seymouri]|eukprot:KPI90348.1 hypothetical protein ABL78_0575 [Leptomonas seymouri]